MKKTFLYSDQKVSSTVFHPAKCPATDDTRLHSSLDLHLLIAGKLFEERQLQEGSIGWYLNDSFLTALSVEKEDENTELKHKGVSFRAETRNKASPTENLRVDTERSFEGSLKTKL